MKLFRAGFALLIAAGVVACSDNTSGSVSVQDPLAGLRYVNLVPDTGAVDFRVIDVVINAPNQVAATFRTGGSPSGVATTFLPPHAPVLAGTRHIRVFMNGTTSAVASQVVLDTTYTFDQGFNYTFYMYGYTRTGQTPSVRALITKDSVPTLAGGKFGLRVLNLAPTLAGNPVGSAATAVDAQVGLETSAVPVPVSAGLPAPAANLAFGQITAYAAMDVGGTTAVPYRMAATATGTTSPIMFQAALPVGSTGTSTTNPIAGTAVAGTAITAVIVPRSASGSAAPQSTPSSVSANIDSVVRSNDTVTVWRRITPGNGSTSCNTAVAAGVSASDILHVSGLTQPEYNGSHAVVSVTAGTSQTGFSQQTVTISNTSAGATYRLKFGADSTLPISYDADSTTVRTMLAALPGIGGNANIAVTGAVGGPYTVQFRGTFANTTVAPMTVTQATQSLGVVVAVLPVLCTGTATASRFRYRIAATPVSPATGAISFKIVTSTNEFTAPTILFLIDQQPPNTAP